jgi:hypothetical protein
MKIFEKRSDLLDSKIREQRTLLLLVGSSERHITITWPGCGAGYDLLKIYELHRLTIAKAQSRPRPRLIANSIHSMA